MVLIERENGTYAIEVLKDGWVYTKDLRDSGATTTKIDKVRGWSESKFIVRGGSRRLVLRPSEEDIDFMYEGDFKPEFIRSGQPYMFLTDKDMGREKKRGAKFYVPVAEGGWVSQGGILMSGVPPAEFKKFLEQAEEKAVEWNGKAMSAVRLYQEDVDSLYRDRIAPAFITEKGDPYLFPLAGERKEFRGIPLDGENGLIPMKKAMKALRLSHPKFVDLVCEMGISVTEKKMPGKGHVAHITNEEYEALRKRLNR